MTEEKKDLGMNSDRWITCFSIFIAAFFALISVWAAVRCL